MNRIEQMIQALCPDGVKRVRLGEIAKLSRGKVISKDYLRDHNGEYPVYSSQTANNGELGKIDTYDFDGKYLTWTTDGAYAGTIFKRDGKFNITNVCGLIEITDSAITREFLYHCLTILAPQYVYQGMGNPKLMSNVMVTIEIPLPPLEVQGEIVKILDRFAVLTAELEAELEGRRKQYEYYRTRLLSFDSDSRSDTVQWKALGEICSNCDNKRKPITSGKRTAGIYPYYGASGIVDYVEGYIFDGDYLLVSEDGANLVARHTPIAFSISGKNWVNNHAHVLQFNTYAERKFVEYIIAKTKSTFSKNEKYIFSSLFCVRNKIKLCG